MTTDQSLLRLLQLVSPGLPIGVYSYSQGLERAVADGLIVNAEETGEWLNGILENCQSRVDIPITARLYDAWDNNDNAALEIWCNNLLAWRETSELRTEDRQTGQALARLLSKMNITTAEHWQRKSNTSLAAMYILAAVTWKIPKQAALLGYLWSWLENQVLCAVKLVPLGQVAGQNLLAQLGLNIPDLLTIGLSLDDHEIGGSAFGLSLSSSRHEMQYCRLFRS